MDCRARDDPASDTPLVCTLRGGGLTDRLRWLSELRRRSLSIARSTNGLTIVFPNEAGLEAELRALAAAEADCCEFLHLAVRRAGESLELAVAGPPAAQPVVEEMFRGRA